MKKVIQKTFWFGATSLFMVFLMVKGVYALSKFGGFPSNLRQVIKDRIFPFIFGAAGVIFVVMFIIGGIQYMSSMGNEEAATKAKKLLMDAIVGIVITVIAYAAARWVVEGIGGTISNVIK